MGTHAILSKQMSADADNLINVDVMSPAFVCSRTLSDTAIAERCVDELGAECDASDVRVTHLPDGSVVCDITSADLSLEYVETLLFENAKLRTAVDEISDDMNALVRAVDQQTNAVAQRRNRRAFENDHSDVALSMRQLTNETREKIDQLETEVAAARAAVVAQRAAARASKSKN